MSEALVVTSKIKKLVKSLGLRTSGSYIDGVSKIVEAKTKEAVEKAKAAGRKTISSEDL